MTEKARYKEWRGNSAEINLASSVPYLIYSSRDSLAAPVGGREIAPNGEAMADTKT